ARPRRARGGEARPHDHPRRRAGRGSRSRPAPRPERAARAAGRRARRRARAHLAETSRRGGPRARARARARATLRATPQPPRTRARPAPVPAFVLLPPLPTPPSGRPPDRCANLSALYVPGEGKSIRAGRTPRGARRAHPHAQHAEREEEGAEQGEEPPGPQQELVESELGECQLVALVAPAVGRRWRGRIRRRAGRRYAAQHLLVLRDLGAAGEHVAEPD